MRRRAAGLFLLVSLADPSGAHAQQITRDIEHDTAHERQALDVYASEAEDAAATKGLFAFVARVVK